MIFLGVVYVILALFLISSIVGDKVNYVREKQAKTNQGEEISEDQKYDLSLDDRAPIAFVFSALNNIGNVGDNLKYSLQYFDVYCSCFVTYTEIYAVLFIVLLLFYKPDKEFEKIEHGSADWASGGEEYKVLSKTEGFILAKDHYLPMLPTPPSGKNGNILVIRRFWFW